MLDLPPCAGPEPTINDARTLSLMDAVHVAIGATSEFRGPEGRLLVEAEIVAESQHWIEIAGGAEATGETIDSNSLPKEEPTINGALLTGVTLVDSAPRLLNQSVPGQALSEEETRQMDIIIACVLLPAYRHPYGRLGEPPVTVDEAFISKRFGTEVLRHLNAVDAGCKEIYESVEGSGKAPDIAPDYHNAVAAILASRLRLAMRTVGEGLMNDELDHNGRPLLSSYRNNTLGQTYGFPDARSYLKRYVELARAAIRLDGVDRELRQKVGQQLVLPAAAVISSFEVGPECLVGKHGAIPVYQNVLDLVRLGFDGAHPFATALGVYFEQARYAERSRRRDGEPLAAHSLRVEESLRPALERLTPTMWRAAIFHDYVEDNIWDTAHPATLVKRAGLAALIAFELSDPPGRGIDDVEKARKFRDVERTPRLMWARELFTDIRRRCGEEEFLNIVIRPANPDYPYSLEAAILKLADFMDTMGIGLCFSERMGKGGWEQSGRRVGVHVNKEEIILQLYERLAEDREGLTRESGMRIGGILDAYARRARAYALRNLEIVCGERGIKERDEFILDFFDSDLDPSAMAGRWDRSFSAVKAPYDEAMAVTGQKLFEVYRPNVHRLQALWNSLGEGRCAEVDRNSMLGG